MSPRRNPFTDGPGCMYINTEPIQLDSQVLSAEISLQDFLLTPPNRLSPSRFSFMTQAASIHMRVYPSIYFLPIQFRTFSLHKNFNIYNFALIRSFPQERPLTI